jgi:hypothetical protein
LRVDLRLRAGVVDLRGRDRVERRSAELEAGERGR